MDRSRTSILAATLALAVTLLPSAAPAAQVAVLADIRQTPLLDDFNRPNENPLSGGGNWARTDSGVWTPLQLINNRVTHQSGSSSSDS